MGRAFGLEADTIVLASVMGRASGPDDWATEPTQMKQRRREEQIFRRDFIATSCESDAGEVIRLNQRWKLYRLHDVQSVFRTAIVKETRRLAISERVTWTPALPTTPPRHTLED